MTNLLEGCRSCRSEALSIGYTVVAERIGYTVVAERNGFTVVAERIGFTVVAERIEEHLTLRLLSFRHILFL
jgi:hypothetical protein